ncbi:XRE family transcriptional regulator, partial [Bifidobacterium animalis]|nr:XRE family transcriptional regulator [Bifidobacterium animalis]
LIGLCLLFLSPAALRGDWSTAVTGMFWVAWPIGGLLCGIAATAIQLFKNYRER